MLAIRAVDPSGLAQSLDAVAGGPIDGGIPEAGGAGVRRLGVGGPAAIGRKRIQHESWNRSFPPDVLAAAATFPSFEESMFRSETASSTTWSPHSPLVTATTPVDRLRAVFAFGTSTRPG